MIEDGDQISAPGDGVRVRREDGVIYVDTPSDGIALDERQARWLAIVALPAMLPGMKTAAEKRDERLGNGR